MADLSTTIGDLRVEGDQLDALVASLTDEQWAGPTPAKGWSIAHQIGHLAWTDRTSLMAVTDPEGFAESLAEAWKNPSGSSTRRPRSRPPGRPPNCWRTGAPVGPHWPRRSPRCRVVPSCLGTARR
ncbi:hypothetical protein BTZ20_1373 [Rhodococcus sp. MTM3W5.2]|nr:hypothetical protein BTZ20_1373 [Rhodococcus sp. MTM3W5.2]